MRRHRILLFAGAALLAAAVFATPACATFHLIKIREVYPGSAASPDSGYVELQMYSSGQDLVAGHALTTYDAKGSPTGTFTFTANVANAANQETILVGDSGVQAAFGVAPYLVDAGLTHTSGGGAACWAATIDCVSWGAFTGTTASPSGSPADPLGIPDGMALRRTIAPNCPTLLQASDDSDDSATDFADTAPAPRPNSAPPSEKGCGLSGGQGTGGGSSSDRPQTRFRHTPGRVVKGHRAVFRFVSSESGSTFLCKLDRRRFRRCRSPLVLRGLDGGRHVFRVEARAPDGATDRTPATWHFRVEL
jgi:hypothetical protein